jgi:hypothetical protein
LTFGQACSTASAALRNEGSDARLLDHQGTEWKPIGRPASGRLHLLTGHDYTLRFVNHATHVATRPSLIHAAGRQLLRM